MDIKIGDIIEGVDENTSVKEGEVIAIGNHSVIVRVTKSHPNSLPVGDLYEILNNWIFNDFKPFYRIKGKFFEIGEEYVRQYQASYMDNEVAKIMELYHLDNPEWPMAANYAVAIVTNTGNGKAYMELMDENDFKSWKLK